ncbi:uncharacterized protein [Dermacentor andersoni]|uniref:uncharacterized protein n=1 Tax=Dermacentor andersoni TaxID=34620 RepID=UPI003B3B25DE
MELVRDFGDPHVLTLAEDHIVLKLDTAWARDVILPKGLSISDEDGLLLVANQRSLVSASKTGLLRGVTISKALFCGCASFDSSDSYRRVAGTLLRETQQLCIIHNRDKVYTLIRMFPNVEILALPHDLCTHALELDEPCRDRSAPMVERSKLKELVGSIGSLRDGCIFLSPETTLAIMRTCPDVGVTSLKMLAKVSAFSNLRSLMVQLLPDITFHEVDRELRKLLPTLPSLEELVLENCGGLMLSTIARLCPKLKSLSLLNGVGSRHDIPVNGDAFPYLEEVEIEMKVLKSAFHSLLSATRDTLRSARFGDDELCISFLMHCLQHGRHSPFSRLEHLILYTERSLRVLQLQPEDLHDVLKALPALRHLQTDSYDLRLFFENYCIPRGRLALSWLHCMHCAVHNPEFHGLDEFCASLVDSLRPRQ